MEWSFFFFNQLLYFAEAATPLYDLWKKIMEPFKKRTTNRAKKFMLKDLPDWGKAGQKTFEDIKMMIADTVVNTYFDSQSVGMCVYRCDRRLLMHGVHSMCTRHRVTAVG